MVLMDFDFAKYFNVDTFDKIIRIFVLVLISVIAIQGSALLVKP